MYIVDKNLSIIQNFPLTNRLIIRSISVVAHTVLFCTDHHLYYLTQEKGTYSSNENSTVSEAVLPYGNIISLAKQRTIVGALSDRILLAEGGKEPRFIVRGTPMLEPLLLGYLATISSAKSRQDMDIELV